MRTEPGGGRTRKISTEENSWTRSLLDEITGGRRICRWEHPPWNNPRFLLPWEDWCNF